MHARLIVEPQDASVRSMTDSLKLMFRVAPMPRYMAELAENPPVPASESVAPASTLVSPWKVLVISGPPRVTAPPLISIPPVPLIAPPNVTESVRLKVRVPPSATSPLMEPEVPPLPSWSVAPVLIVVPPEYVLVPVSVTGPAMTSEPLSSVRSLILPDSMRLELAPGVRTTELPIEKLFPRETAPRPEVVASCVVSPSETSPVPTGPDINVSPHSALLAPTVTIVFSPVTESPPLKVLEPELNVIAVPAVVPLIVRATAFEPLIAPFTTIFDLLRLQTWLWNSETLLSISR